MKKLAILIALVLPACGKYNEKDVTKNYYNDVPDSGIVEVIDPCGDEPGSVDEVLFRLWTGEIAAWYKNTGFVILEPGQYRTTDYQKCVFTVTEDYEVIYGE